MPETIIVGAGPAGISAANSMIEISDKVTVYERFSSPGIKPCGEGTLDEILSYIPLSRNEYEETIKSTFDSAVIARGKYSIEIKIPKKCYVLDKRMFLRKMISAVESKGVRFTMNRHVTRNEMYRWANSGNTVIDATGFPRISAEIKSRPIPVLRAYSKNNHSIDEGEILIHFPETGEGYFWIFPYGDIYNIGFGGHFSSAETRNYFDLFVKKYGLEIISGIDGAGLVVSGTERNPVETVGGGKIIRVGEAAGTVNPGTGEGIRFSLLSGIFSVSENYSDVQWNKFGRDLVRSIKISKALAEMPGEKIKSMFEKSSPEDIIRLFDGRRPRIMTAVRTMMIYPKILRAMF